MRNVFSAMVGPLRWARSQLWYRSGSSIGGQGREDFILDRVD